MGGLVNKTYSLLVLDAAKSKVKVPVNSVPGDVSLQLLTTDFLLYLHMNFPKCMDTWGEIERETQIERGEREFFTTLMN